MADIDAGLNIGVNAVANEDSADKAVNKLDNRIKKNGHIEVPIDITVPIDKTNAKLTKAQNAIVKEINRMTSEGFSASGEDIVKLNKKFNQFKSEFKDAGGVQKYSDAFQQIKKDVDLIERRFRKLNGASQKVVKAASNAWTKEIKERESKKTKYEGLETAKPKGYKKGTIDPGRTSEYETRMSELSSYPSGMNRQMLQSEKDFYKTVEGSKVTTRIDKEEAEERATALIEQKNRKRKPNAAEEARELSEVIRNNILTDLLDQIRTGESEDAINPLITELTATMQTISNLNQEAGKLIIDDVKKTIGTAMGKAGFTTFGNIGGTNGEDKTDKSRDPKMERALQTILNEIAKKEDEIVKEQIKLEELMEKSITKSSTKTKTSEKETNTVAKRLINETKTAQAQSSEQISDAVKKVQNETTKQTRLDTIEHSAERVADSKAGEMSRTLNDIEKTDAEDGFNSESNAQLLLSEVKSLKTIFEKCPCEDILKTISDNIKTIVNIIGGEKEPPKPEKVGNWDTNLPMTIPGEEARTLKRAGRPKKVRRFIDNTDEKALRQKMAAASIERERDLIEQGQHPSQQRSDATQTSKDISKISKVFNSIKSAFGAKSAFGPTVDEIMAMNEEEQRKIETQLIERYGLLRKTGDPNATRDKGQVYRTKSLYGWGKNNVNPFADLQLTEGINIDSKGITEALQKAIQKNMFNMQTGGWFKNIIGPMTLYAGQPSLEKSRAEIEALNSIMANIRDKALTLLQGIQTKELQLRGLEEAGKAKFNADGTLSEGSSNEAFTIFAQLEEQKMALNGVLAEASKVDDISASLNYNAHDILKVLGFINPLLKDNNKIIQNINAGLDKNGKALKFQKRSQEVMNYSFQLMSRHIGQMIKNWMLMLNPINLIKKAFSDFASYDTKWQRTINVIKYNIRRIIRPALEWIAQQIVNIIGLVNALIKGIGQAFGKDWDLFDQSAANAEKMREELEAATNVSAGFDELHDIGSDNSAAGDLMGDIYTPQWDSLYEGIQAFGEKVASIFKKIKETVEGWSFWEWLAVGAGVVAGVLLFKWLIDLFSKGKNPVQSVADGFKTLEKLAGLALVIASIAALTEALKDFIETVGKMKQEEVDQALLALAGALAIVAATVIGIIWGVTAVIDGTLGTAALGIAAIAAIIAAIALVIAAMAGLTLAINELVKTIVEHIDEVVLLMKTAGVIIMAIINTIGETIKGIIQTIGNAISQIINTIITGIQNTITTIGNTIVNVIQGVANTIMTVLQPIMDFIDSIISKITELATTIAHEIGETIRSVVKTVGDIIIGIIHELLNAIPNLLNSILRFCREIGPAIENSVDAIMRSVTKLINFIISGVEYMINTLIIGSINKVLSKFGNWSISSVSIDRFVPKYEKGTNYVPNDGLAYLHQGEAVVPKKYNQPYQQGLSNEERSYMQQMMATMRSLDGTMKQGIKVNGEFRQRGSDLVAVVNKTNSQTGADLLSNVSYAR